MSYGFCISFWVFFSLPKFKSWYSKLLTGIHLYIRLWDCVTVGCNNFAWYQSEKLTASNWGEEKVKDTWVESLKWIHIPQNVGAHLPFHSLAPDPTNARAKSSDQYEGGGDFAHNLHIQWGVLCQQKISLSYFLCSAHYAIIYGWPGQVPKLVGEPDYVWLDSCCKI